MENGSVHGAVVGAEKGTGMAADEDPVSHSLAVGLWQRRMECVGQMHERQTKGVDRRSPLHDARGV